MPIISTPVDVGASFLVILSGLPIYYFTIYREDIANKISIPFSKLSFVTTDLYSLSTYLWVEISCVYTFQC